MAGNEPPKAPIPCVKWRLELDIGGAVLERVPSTLPLTSRRLRKKRERTMLEKLRSADIFSHAQILVLKVWAHSDVVVESEASAANSRTPLRQLPAPGVADLR